MAWKNPIVKKGVVPGASCEVTPFVFKERLYRVENFKASTNFPGRPAQYRFHEDGFRIRDVEKDQIISIPLLNHYFAIAYVWQDRVYVYAGDYEQDLPWCNIRKLIMISSTDLITWTAPQIVLTAESDEHLFNTDICHDGKRFVMLYETDDESWPKFTFKFCESDDLVHWRKIPDALYGTNRYVGGPALYFEDNWYYSLYLEDLGEGYFETRITRSRDLIDWQDAPADRPFMTFDPERFTNPIHYPEVKELNASDVELCEWKGKTIIYFNGGDQLNCGDVQSAEFDGCPRELFEYFFKSK